MTKKRAFTLIELLIVIAIIGILFIVLVSKVDFATDKAKATGVQTDFRSFQMAFDTVAKENAGFNTFGWDTGDANQNGKRDSYDEGDTNKNGIQDGTEVFTGHKVYDEAFTKVFSLKKNGTGSYDRDALNRLETAINANLDPKLHITIKDDGEIVMANGARDPWNKEYHGYYISNAETDGKDRGAIVMYSDGANNEFGSEHSISNGIVSISIPGNNKYGKDDYSIVSCYTYVNGYGEVLNASTGFSNNQSFLNGNNNVNNDSSLIVPDDSFEEPVITEPKNEYGFYYNALQAMQEKKALSSRGRGRLRGFLELRRPWGFSPEARRGSQGASRAAPGKSGLHARGEGERVLALESREGTRASRRVEEGLSRSLSGGGGKPSCLLEDYVVLGSCLGCLLQLLAKELYGYSVQLFGCIFSPAVIEGVNNFCVFCEIKLYVGIAMFDA